MLYVCLKVIEEMGKGASVFYENVPRPYRRFLFSGHALEYYKGHVSTKRHKECERNTMTESVQCTKLTLWGINGAGFCMYNHISNEFKLPNVAHSVKAFRPSSLVHSLL